MNDVSPPRVLIADDDGVTRAMVSAWLGRSGYEVIVACDGNEALEVALRELPDLLLVDVTMPGRDGYSVCREVQAASTVPPPVIFLTAHAQTSDRVAGLDAGAVDYMVKPFAQAELTARVRAALRTKAVRDGFIEKATRDGLTGLLNRHEVDLQTDAAITLAGRHGRQLSLLMLDIDHFKLINDRFGHAAGDEVLRKTALRIATACRGSDVVGRYGGEEFVVLLPETGADEAGTTGDKVRRVLSEQSIRCGTTSVSITASVGVAEWEPEMTGAALCAAADEALYRAKRDGRDRTELYRSNPDQTT